MWGEVKHSGGMLRGNLPKWGTSYLYMKGRRKESLYLHLHLNIPSSAHPQQVKMSLRGLLGVVQGELLEERHPESLSRIPPRG